MQTLLFKIVNTKFNQIKDGIVPISAKLKCESVIYSKTSHISGLIYHVVVVELVFYYKVVSVVTALEN